MTRKWKIIILGIGIFIFLIFIFLTSSPQKKQIQGPLDITSSTPTNNATNVSVFNPISVTFNQAIDSSTVSVSSNPVETWTITQKTVDTIQINHNQYLRSGTNYKLTVLVQGTSIGTINFQTEQPQNDPRQIQQLQEEQDKDYPLRTLLPYETADFKVVYTDPLTFEIDLKTNITSDQAISEVKAWVSSNGVDPNTHKYNVVLKK